MKINPVLESLPDYPFDQLRQLLADITPTTDAPPLVLSIGEPKHEPPKIIADTIAENSDLWSRYPPGDGTKEFRSAAINWLNNRYQLSDLINADDHVLPVVGTREALYLITTVAVTVKPGQPKPIIAMPNPLYHVYGAAAVVSGADCLYLTANKDNGFIPDITALDASTLDRIQIYYLCSPSNPQGAVADIDTLKKAIKCSRKHNFLLVADECYADIYDQEKPPGILQACQEMGGSLHNVITFHSLSKRSSAPGLRSGFVAGDPAFIKMFKRIRNYIGPQMPMPLMAAAVKLWNDEKHVIENRKLYQAKFDLAEKILGSKINFVRPKAGFFLWLDVGDGEKMTKKLWSEYALRVLPGAYISAADENNENPGHPYIRVALVHDLKTTEMALKRLVKVL